MPDHPAGMIDRMAIHPELEINVDLYEALTDVLGSAPDEPTPVVVLASYLYGLAKGYGLSDSNHLTESQLERADAPAPVVALVNHAIADGVAHLDGELLRDRLYLVIVELSLDLRARRLLNKNEALSEVGLRKVAQIFWNLEGTDSRPKLPIRSGQKIGQAEKERPADIKVPDANRDFAVMRWTERTTTGATGLGPGQAYRSSGQGFRKQGARLAALAAERFITACSQPVPGMGAAEMRLVETRGGNLTAVITWPESPRQVSLPAQLVDQIAAGAGRPQLPNLGRVVMGSPPEVGKLYQRRDFDDEIDKTWAAGGDRRIWLRGGPGVGKSYSARRVMDDAIADQGEDREELLIWVDSADAVSVATALSQAVDRMPRLRLGVVGEDHNKVHRQARAILDELAFSSWRWLIVLDNADAASLIGSEMIPPGRNPNGRVLITTSSADARIESRGEVITAGLFTPDEADAYLGDSLGSAAGRTTSKSTSASTADNKALARAVGFHPLGLSVAAATIATNRMEIPEWLEELETAKQLDVAADAPDPGGYPHGIGAIWQIALEKASQGMPDGIVERAAAVAAVMDPDGHPTWLWSRDAVATWITGTAGTLTLHHGRPVTVERLIAHGLLELKGGNWRDGLLAMHQLAARAVRELNDKALLGDIAGVLLDELAGDEAPDDRYFSPVGSVIATLARLLAVPGVEPSGRARGFLFLGELRSDMFESSEALTAYENAWDLAQSVAHDEDSTAEGLQLLALQQLGRMQSLLGQDDEALRASQRCLEIAQSLAESGNAETRRGGILAVGAVLRDLGRPEESATYFSRALDLQPTEPDGEDEERVKWLRSVGFLQLLLGREPEAGRSLTRALEILDHLDWNKRASTASGIASALKPIQLQLGHLREAEQTQTQLVDALGRLAKGGSLSARGAHADALKELADMIKEDPRRQQESMALYTRAVDAFAEFTVASPGRFEHTMQIDALIARGHNYASNGRHDEAAESFGEAAKIAQTLIDLTAGDPVATRAMRQRHADACLFLGMSQVGRLVGTRPSSNDDRAARASLAFAVEEYARLTEEDPADHDMEYRYALAIFRLGNWQHVMGEHEDAAASLVRAAAILSLLAELAPDAPGDSGVLHTLVLSLVELGDVQSESGKEAEASGTYHRLLLLADRAPDDSRGFVAIGLFSWADLLDRFGLPDSAAQVRAVAASLVQGPDVEE